MGVEVAGEAVEVAAEAGAVAEQAVEPCYAGRDPFHYGAYKDHGEEGARPYHIPEPCAEVEESDGYGDDHEAYVYHYLGFWECQSPFAADGCGEPFAWHRDGAAFDLEGDAGAEDDATEKLRENAGDEVVEGNERGYGHVDVEQPSEDEPYEKLEELHGLEHAAEDEELQGDEDAVHHVGPLADGERCQFSGFAGYRHDEGDGGYDAAAERGADAERYSESHDEEGDDEKDVLPDETCGLL